jgi:hypothetical protein
MDIFILSKAIALLPEILLLMSFSLYCTIEHYTRGARAIKVVVVKYCAFLCLPVDRTKGKILSFSVKKYFQEGEQGEFDLTIIEDNNGEVSSLYKKRTKTRNEE